MYQREVRAANVTEIFMNNGVSHSSVASSLAQVVRAGMATAPLPHVDSRRRSSPSPLKMDPAKPSLYCPTVLILTEEGADWFRYMWSASYLAV